MPLGQNMAGTGKLSEMIFSEVKNQVDGQRRMIDFGVILEDMSLKLNAYPIIIPVEQYLVCRSVALPTIEMLTTEQTVAKNKLHRHLMVEFEAKDSIGGIVEFDPPIEELGVRSVEVKQEPHDHDYNTARPSEWHLCPGDRVLVVWVSNDPVIVDVLTSIRSASRRYGDDW